MDEYDTELDFCLDVLDDGPPYDDFQMAMLSYVHHMRILAGLLEVELEATQAYLLDFD